MIFYFNNYYHLLYIIHYGIVDANDFYTTKYKKVEDSYENAPQYHFFKDLSS